MVGFPARRQLLGLLVSSFFTAVTPDTQMALSSDTAENAESLGELPDLVQTGIWLESNTTDSSGTSCCNVLKGVLADHLFFPNSAEYQAQQSGYYSLRQSDLQPACRVLPTSAADVATIVKLAAQHGCAFAVRSGGHTISMGSNIDSSGFTIDLRRMNQISISGSEKGPTVSFGSGCIWHDVYSALQPHNLTTAGARVPGVGVSGFLLGGGISALSLAHGLASLSVLNYEVVHADGTIHDVNAENLPDLYWALKYGSTNFAIVTRFEMATYPLSEVWAGSLSFDISEGPALLQFQVDLTANLATDPKAFTAFGLMWDVQQQAYIIWLPSIYLSPVPFPSLYSGLQPFIPKALHNTLRITDFLTAIKEVEDGIVPAERVEWFTFTIRADAGLLWDIHSQGVQLFAPHTNRTGFTHMTISQSLSKGFAAASADKGGTPAGVLAEEGDALLVLIMISWADQADDQILLEKAREHGRWSQDTARARGLLQPFIYMNYASSAQDVMGGIGAKNLAQMRKIKNLYDPENRFGRYWRGGFKL
ncbi:hypothetical protein C8R46DRAFT_1186003 [Mycena filopes]|nr:hypothetical protein C8R46DRAFT_1186003 [Mycena filopes]